MKYRISPFLWSSLIMALAVALALFLSVQEKSFFETQEIASPDISAGPVTAYFFGVVVLMGLVLFFIRSKRLALVFRVLFALIFAWGVFIVFILIAPLPIPYILAIIAGITWLFWARIWLHNLLLLITLAGAGSVFGFLFSPWTFMIFMLVVAVYDILAVRFGFMVWMADRLSETYTLPAFVFPRKIRDWGLLLKNVQVGKLEKEDADRRGYGILGGGDIGFPLMFAASVFFAANLPSAVCVGFFALVGVVIAYLIQLLWLKGKPMPALPPITFLSLIGFLLATRFLS